jgi:hypothetical protein
MVPFFVPHTDHVELAIKIVTYLKKKPPLTWISVEEKSVSLGEEASRKLLRALETHLQVAQKGEDGSYLVVRVSEGTAFLGQHDPSKVAKALTQVLSQPEIVEHLEKTELSTQLIAALRGAIRLSEMRTAVATLRENLVAGKCEESVYQEWCDKHSWALPRRAERFTRAHNAPRAVSGRASRAARHAKQRSSGPSRSPSDREEGF